MRRLVLALLVLGALTFPVVSRAEAVADNFELRTTGDLVALCSSQPVERLFTAAQNFCQGFAVGTYRTVMALQAGQRVALICPPVDMPSRSVAMGAFVQWAQATPARLQMPAVDGFSMFLVERAPCAPSRNSR